MRAFQFVERQLDSYGTKRSITDGACRVMCPIVIVFANESAGMRSGQGMASLKRQNVHNADLSVAVPDTADSHVNVIVNECRGTISLACATWASAWQTMETTHYNDVIELLLERYSDDRFKARQVRSS
jgi:hypothetical protein